MRLPVEFFVPLPVEPKQSTRSTMLWKWENITFCPFCRSNVKYGSKKCNACGAGWRGASRAKVPFLKFHKSTKIQKNETELLRWFYHRGRGEPLDGPVALDLIVYQEWPKSTLKRVRAAGVGWNATRPDRDNYTKQVQDVLEKAGFVTNDARIVAGDIKKQYADYPGVYVRMYDPGEPVMPSIVQEFMQSQKRMVS